MAEDTSDRALLFQDRWEVVYDELRSLILKGEFAPGARIHEAQIAQRYGVSRGPVRTAITALQSAGLIVREPRRAAYVTPLTRQDVVDVYDLREVLEVLAIQKSMTDSPELLAEMLLSRVETFRSKTWRDLADMELVEADVQLHASFYRASGNARLVSAWESITDPIRTMMRFSLVRESADWVQKWEHHSEIVNEAISGNIENTTALALSHLAQGKHDVLERLQTIESSDRSSVKGV